MGRHWCLGFAALTQLRTCVNARLSRARPVCLGCYTQDPGPHDPHRLLQLKRSTSTPTTIQTTMLRAASELTAHRVASSLAGKCQPSFFRFGVATVKPLACNPHCDDRSPKWIYPNLSASDTLCRKPTLHATWKQVSGSSRAVTAPPKRD